MRLVSGHVAVLCAMPADVAAQEEVICCGRVSVGRESGCPGGEVIGEERVDRCATGRAGDSLGLSRVERSVAQHLVDRSAGAGDVTDGEGPDFLAAHAEAVLDRHCRGVSHGEDRGALLQSFQHHEPDALDREWRERPRCEVIAALSRRDVPRRASPGAT